MSKTSKPRDLADQVNTAARNREGFCIGCGYYHAVNNEHRADCTLGRHEQIGGTWP